MKEMEAIFGESSYIDSWMQLVRKVSWNFPGLETEENLEEHKQTVLKFMNKLQAVCVKDSDSHRYRNKGVRLSIQPIIFSQKTLYFFNPFVRFKTQKHLK